MRGLFVHSSVLVLLFFGQLVFSNPSDNPYALDPRAQRPPEVDEFLVALRVFGDRATRAGERISSDAARTEILRQIRGLIGVRMTSVSVTIDSDDAAQPQFARFEHYRESKVEAEQAIVNALSISDLAMLRSEFVGPLLTHVSTAHLRRLRAELADITLDAAIHKPIAHELLHRSLWDLLARIQRQSFDSKREKRWFWNGVSTSLSFGLGLTLPIFAARGIDAMFLNQGRFAPLLDPLLNLCPPAELWAIGAGALLGTVVGSFGFVGSKMWRRGRLWQLEREMKQLAGFARKEGENMNMFWRVYFANPVYDGTTASDQIMPFKMAVRCRNYFLDLSSRR